MNTNNIRDSFLRLCADPIAANGHYVCLYIRKPFYGGPEEGGWWGSDTELVAYQRVSSDEEADVLVERIEAMAEELNEQAKREFGKGCLRQMEWLEQRGLDSDFLPEVDGEESYFVVQEDRPGAAARQGSRHWD